MDMAAPATLAAPPAKPFDYDGADDATVQDAEAAVARYRSRTKAYVLDTSRDLLAMKERLGHGTFLRWVDEAMGLTPRTAQNFMSAAAQLGSEGETVSHLPPTTLYKLAAASTPEPIRQEIITRLKAREALSAQAIEERVAEGKDEAKKQAMAAREATRRAALTQEQRDEEDALSSRGAKRREALDRKEERERQARAEEERRQTEEAARGAAFLVDRLGAEETAAFFARFDTGGLMWKVFEHARATAAARLAQPTEPVEIRTILVARRGRIAEFHRPSPEEQAEIQAEADRIEQGAKVEPIPVQRQPGSRELYDVVSDHVRFRAVADVLHRQTIPVRIAPVVEPLAGL